MNTEAIWQARFQKALAAYAQHIEQRHNVPHASAVDVAQCVAAHIGAGGAGCVPDAETRAFATLAELVGAGRDDIR